MNFKVTALLLASVAALSACKESEIDLGNGFLSSGTFSQGYITDWAADSGLANWLIGSDSRYTNQDHWTNLSNGGAAVFHNAYRLANVHFAHAANGAALTGAGQTIAVFDNGFRDASSATHQQMAGKSVTTLAGNALQTDRTSSGTLHGLYVSSIAAGNGQTSNMIGVAPGANLLWADWGDGSYAGDLGAAATQFATNRGAIVQNNSWGFSGSSATNSSLNAILGGANSAYIAALGGFSQNGIVVFAVDNDALNVRTSAPLMAGLPRLIPSLENSWIAVVNASSTSGGAILESAACFEAARWCMAADGNTYGANLTSVGASTYKFGNGSSYAAPQVSGAVALLGQAFPGLSAQAIRARLLASADNSSYSHSKFVTFAPGITHGYNASVGHGFLDLKAALSPIGGSYMPAAQGDPIPIDQPLVVSGGMVGNAVSQRIANYDIAFSDGLGADFSHSASLLTAEALPLVDPRTTLFDLLGTDLAVLGSDPFRPTSNFSPFVPGQELEFGLETASLTFLLPETGSGNGNFGMSLEREIDLAGAELALGLSAMHEGGSFVGMRTMSPDAKMTATHASATFDWTMPLSDNQDISLSGSAGIAVPGGDIPAVSMSAAAYNSLSVSYGARNIWSNGDRFSIGVGLPQAVSSGYAEFALPTVASDGSTSFGLAKIPLTPDGRQVDLSISYGVPLDNGSEIIMSAKGSVNSGNIAGNDATEAAIGWRFQF